MTPKRDAVLRRNMTPAAKRSCSLQNAGGKPVSFVWGAFLSAGQIVSDHFTGGFLDNLQKQCFVHR